MINKNLTELIFKLRRENLLLLELLPNLYNRLINITVFGFKRLVRSLKSSVSVQYFE